MRASSRFARASGCAFGWALLAALVSSPWPVMAQPGDSDEISLAAAESYERVYGELMGLTAIPERGAEVDGLVLRRDVGTLKLERGRLFLLSPVGDRIVAATFVGQGTFSFAPTSKIEQERLFQFHDVRALEEPLTEVLLFFADSTLEELEARLVFGTMDVPRRTKKLIEESLEYLGDDDSQTFDVDVMTALLNGERSGMFYAHVKPRRGEPVMFAISPDRVESVRLLMRASNAVGKAREVLCQFRPTSGDYPGPATGELTRYAAIRHYAIETSLPRTGSGEVRFAAAARVDITSKGRVGPWVAFHLYSKLGVDSARWRGADDEPATVFKGKESTILWVRLKRPIDSGQTQTLLIHYHGDLIDRYGEWFFIKSSIAWYPRSLEGRSRSTFDLTYHSSKSYLLASIGDLVDSSEVDRVVTTRWVTPQPVRNASFNLGQFEEIAIDEEGVPPVTVLYAEQGHRQLGQGGGNRRKMKERVTTDVGKSMKFFQHVFGPPPIERFYATEIPFGHGEAFPGLVHLSWATFYQTEREGGDEVFRAHEVAHQWWGVGVDFATYHDQWLSEGFATFSGLWYLQKVHKDKRKYFDTLERWRADIIDRGAESGPISLGYRTNTGSDRNDYQTIVYQKGAWVLHMLRILMLDLRTMNEDPFTAMMRDFYSQYRGKQATTEDFRRVVELHVGANMKWFFDQWVFGADIPTYRVAYRSKPVEGGKYRVTVRIEQQDVPEDFRVFVPVSVDLGKDRWARMRVEVRVATSEIDLPLMPAEPKGVKFNDLEGVLAEVKMVKWGG